MIDYKKCWDKLKERFVELSDDYSHKICNAENNTYKAIFDAIKTKMEALEKKHKIS